MGLMAPFTRVLSSESAADAQPALHALISTRPAACAAVLQHHLPPAAAELLIQHLEAADVDAGILNAN